MFDSSDTPIDWIKNEIFVDWDKHRTENSAEVRGQMYNLILAGQAADGRYLCMRNLFLTLITTFALMCAGCAAIGFMQNTADINRGTLFVTAGTSVDELRRETTFDLGKGSKHRATETRTFANAARFDWHLPGTNLTFKDCSNYFLTTDETGKTIEDIQIITAQKYYTWDELKAELVDIEK